MSEIRVEIDHNHEATTSDQNITWAPLRNGEIFKNYLEKKNKISEKDKKKLIDDSVGLLGKCINPGKISETKHVLRLLVVQ